jgi:hypothetical protein
VIASQGAGLPAANRTALTGAASLNRHNGGNTDEHQPTVPIP